ncbi:MAG: dihydrofolate reductase [Candidatus Pelagadaptatus aseana]|uniref:dihydrofolate reductase n=1 Tax=Candidatus Pelagadaptatus aseana TaxID=3120508 RepID=UPI0039B196C5
MDQSVIPLALIVAQSSNRVIGIENQLPWHLPEDLKYFKSVTLGKPVIMGRKTYDSIGRPLPGRKNIVITRQPDWQADGVVAVNDLASAVTMAREEAGRQGVAEVMVIGGAQIYAEALPMAQRIYVTRVDVELEGDAFFPPLSEADWLESSCSETLMGDIEGQQVGYVFAVLDRC